jgi:hypothetical protein
MTLAMTLRNAISSSIFKKKKIIFFKHVGGTKKEYYRFCHNMFYILVKKYKQMKCDIYNGAIFSIVIIYKSMYFISAFILLIMLQ